MPLAIFCSSRNGFVSDLAETPFKFYCDTAQVISSLFVETKNKMMKLNEPRHEKT